jgi:hypothetical protein
MVNIILNFRKWLLKLIDESDRALAEDAEHSRRMGIGETSGKLYMNQGRFNYPELSAIWRLDESSRRLEILTIVLAILTVILIVRTFLP